jgi:hypothetical protein
MFHVNFTNFPINKLVFIFIKSIHDNLKINKTLKRTLLLLLLLINLFNKGAQIKLSEIFKDTNKRSHLNDTLLHYSFQKGKKIKNPFIRIILL